MEAENRDYLPSKWVCHGNDYRRLPDSVIDMGTEAFRDDTLFQKVVQLIAEDDEVSYTRIPLMPNIEAIAYGGKVSCINNMYLIKEYPYKKLEEIKIRRGELLQKDEIHTLLQYIGTHKEEDIMLDIEGPFTVLSGLVRTEQLFMNARKNPELLLNLLMTIAEDLADYAKEAIARGAKFISFSDPQTGIDLVGEKFYEQFNGRALIHFIDEVEPYLDHAIIHICGKTSFGLLKTGLIKRELAQVEKIDYRQLMWKLAANPEYRVIGNACINDAHLQTGSVNKLLVNV